MVTKTRQYRHEIKFTISKKCAKILKDRLLAIMSIDENGKNGYFIRSLYYDTPNQDAYYEKIDGVLYRNKYRIRIYNHDDGFIRLEKKMKHNNMTAKEQTRISKEICMKILDESLDIHYIEDGLLKEFYVKVKINHLCPSVLVDYERLALTYPVSDVRVTFDYNISSGRYNYDLFNYQNNDYKVIKDDLVVLEVKYNDILPEPIKLILGTIPSNREAFSKFASARSIK